MLEAETAAREQAEERSKKLRDEMFRLKGEGNSVPLGTQSMIGSVPSYSAGSDTNQNLGNSLHAELELLIQENAELRKEVGAQASMLTSRNREKERLYQEIEELKLGQGHEGGGRSITGDSILDRSASRMMRQSSRGSGGTRTSPTSDVEREELETRNDQLRDKVSLLKLENQELRAQNKDFSRELEKRDNTYQNDVDQADAEIQSLEREMNQAIMAAGERDAAVREAQEEIDALEEELNENRRVCEHQETLLRSRDESLQVLQAEVRAAGEGIMRLEEDAQNNLKRYQAVQQGLDDSNREIDSLETNLVEANAKVQRLTVQIESSANEIAFLREEQDSDKIKISDLESELKTSQMSLASERERAQELEQRLADERHQREVVGGREKQEVQRIMNNLNREVSVARDEARKLKKSLSVQEIEANTWKERLLDLENNLRETLGDLDGSRSSLITSIINLQRELETTALNLESTRANLDEKETTLSHRDALLESHGLESRKLGDLLDRERQARRADKKSFDQALKSHSQASRTIAQTGSRISELEGARSQDRKRFSIMEQQYKDQLGERNSMLLTIWKRLSAMCGPEWTHSNSLINGNLPSQEVIGNILFWPGFSRNLLLAIKTVDNVISGFRNRVRAVERDLTKQYQSLEHTFNLRVKRLDRVEEAVRNMRTQQQQSQNSSATPPEMAKIKGENRLLRAELNLTQSRSQSRRPPPGIGSSSEAESHSSQSVVDRNDNDMGMRLDGLPRRSLSMTTATDTRSEHRQHHPGRESRSERNVVAHGQPGHFSSATSLASGTVELISDANRHGRGGSDERWLYRIHELEKRVILEREGRRIDRDGARRRMDDQDAENEKLRAQLEKERAQRDFGK